MAAEQPPEAGLTEAEIKQAARLAAEIALYVENHEARFIRSGFLIHCLTAAYAVRPESKSLVAQHLGTAFSALHVCSAVFDDESSEGGEI